MTAGHASPASKITRIAGSPGRPCPAPISRVMTSRTYAAVHHSLVVPGAQARRVRRRGPEVRPGSSATTTEYGQPGIICAWPLARPYTWQNNRSGLVARRAAASY